MSKKDAPVVRKVTNDMEVAMVTLPLPGSLIAEVENSRFSSKNVQFITFVNVNFGALKCKIREEGDVLLNFMLFYKFSTLIKVPKSIFKVEISVSISVSRTEISVSHRDRSKISV